MESILRLLPPSAPTLQGFRASCGGERPLCCGGSAEEDTDDDMWTVDVEGQRSIVFASGTPVKPRCPRSRQCKPYAAPSGITSKDGANAIAWRRKLEVPADHFVFLHDFKPQVAQEPVRPCAAAEEMLAVRQRAERRRTDRLLEAGRPRVVEDPAPVDAVADERQGIEVVELSMYDLSGGIAKLVPSALLSGHKFEGVWHTGIRVFGKEIWFGGYIFESQFDESPFGVPARVLRLGQTARTYQELMEFVKDELAKAFNCASYDVLRRNCNHFSNEVSKFLLRGHEIPTEVIMQPQWAENMALVKILRPAINTWLGGFNCPDQSDAAPEVVHMTREEKQQEQCRLEAQWAEWAEPRRQERALEVEEHRREAAEQEFQTWMLEQHQKMQHVGDEDCDVICEVDVTDPSPADEELPFQRQVEDAEEERRREAEQMLCDVLATVRAAATAGHSADAAAGDVLGWAVHEAQVTGVAKSAPGLLQDAELELLARRMA